MKFCFTVCLLVSIISWLGKKTSHSLNNTTCTKPGLFYEDMCMIDFSNVSFSVHLCVLLQLDLLSAPLFCGK